MTLNRRAVGNRAAAATAVVAAAALLLSCSNEDILLDSSFRPVDTEFTVGAATFTTTLPEGTRVIELTEEEGAARGDAPTTYVMYWPGHDLSANTVADLLGPRPATLQRSEEMVQWLFKPVSCEQFDLSRSGDDTVDATSPLNGQPVTYIRHQDAPPPDDGIVNSFYLIKLDREPCQAVWAMAIYSKNSPDNPLKDLGQRLFVEGHGTLTTTTR